MNTCRLAVTAAFARGMPNFNTIPRRAHFDADVAVYHAMPHGLQDGLRQAIVPEFFVNTGLVQQIKREALACHRSQKDWLDVSQGMGSYVAAMDDMSRAVGRMSRCFNHAEGWRRHSHLGFGSENLDPLKDAVARHCRLHRGVRTRSKEASG